MIKRNPQIKPHAFGLTEARLDADAEGLQSGETTGSSHLKAYLLFLSFCSASLSLFQLQVQLGEN